MHDGTASRNLAGTLHARCRRCTGRGSTGDECGRVGYTLFVRAAAPVGRLVMRPPILNERLHPACRRSLRRSGAPSANIGER